MDARSVQAAPAVAARMGRPPAPLKLEAIKQEVSERRPTGICMHHPTAQYLAKSMEPLGWDLGGWSVTGIMCWVGSLRPPLLQ